MHVVKVLSGWVGMCVFVQYVSIISLNITNVIIVFIINVIYNLQML